MLCIAAAMLHPVLAQWANLLMIQIVVSSVLFCMFRYPQKIVALTLELELVDVFSLPFLERRISWVIKEESLVSNHSATTSKRG
jgi:hypothetical protein